MATPQEKLAESLNALREIQNEDGIAVISPGNLSRSHKDRLIQNGFLQEVIRGWYISTRPGRRPGETSNWYPSFWYFISIYFEQRFQDEWCLSPEQSLSIHSESLLVPKQLLVRSPKAHNHTIDLLHKTSFFELKVSLPDKKDLVKKYGLNLYSLPAALIACSPDFFTKHPIEARTALLSIKDSSELLEKLLSRGHSKIAGRLAGAFRNIGQDQITNELLGSMKHAGFDVREVDPFNEKLQAFGNSRESSPYVNRIKLMWQEMREVVIEKSPKEPGLSSNIEGYLKAIDDIYTTDAYHSLSIEGYRVTPELIEKVRTGKWNPDENKEDEELKNAMAARGYWQAFLAVRGSIKKILDGEDPGTVANKEYSAWYQNLFGSSVTAGILKASDLAGFRNDRVIISGSMHIPPGPEAVREAMPALFDLIKEEKEPFVRAVLGHFFFVYIHPYRDGNGRMARFLMNTQLASGGYSWTVIELKHRDEYMHALEKASVEQDISDFARFVTNQLNKGTVNTN